MGYDVIETFVATNKKNIVAASVIQLEGDTQFIKYLPLEMSSKVYPYFEELKCYIGNFDRCAKRIQDDFILCGYFLNCIRLNGLYRYCIQEGLQGYTNFYTFCDEIMGISTTTVKRLILINSHFCKNTDKLPEAYKRFGASKLAIMATFENGLEGKMQSSITTRQLEKLRKYYSSHEWKVDINTTWQDDLRKFEIEQAENRLAKSARLKEKSFQQVENIKKSVGIISDTYKAYTKFFDDTLQEVDKLKNSKDERFSPIVAELEKALRLLQDEVLKMQADEMLDGL